MHKILLQQLHEYVGSNTPIPDLWNDFFVAVSEMYEQFDIERTLSKQSLEVSSSELKSTVALLRATLDSTDDGILVVGTNQDILNYNKKFLEILELSEDNVKKHNAQYVTQMILKNISDPTSLHVLPHILDDTMSLSNDTIVLTDGRTIEQFSKPQQVDGVTVGRVWSYRDVTLRVHAEDQLKKEIITLEKLNRVMVDRELKMIELKHKIKSLEEERSGVFKRENVTY